MIEFLLNMQLNIHSQQMYTRIELFEDEEKYGIKIKKTLDYQLKTTNIAIGDFKMTLLHYCIKACNLSLKIKNYVTSKK